MTTNGPASVSGLDGDDGLHISGEGGDVSGGSGNDILSAIGGPATVHGDSGDDRIDVRDSEVGDTALCGDGLDVANIDAGDVVDATCEEVITG